MGKKTLALCGAVLLSTVSPIHGQVAPAKAQVTALIDSTGKYIGPMLSQNTVVLSMQGQAVAVSLFSSGFVPNAVIYYESNDCSGQPYISATELPRVGYVSKSGSIVMYASDETKNIKSGSLKVISNDGLETCSADSSNDRLVGEQLSTSISSLGFTPPFSVQLR